MSRWTWPAYVGLVGGALLFVALLVPVLAAQTRRYGQVSGPRLLVAAGVAVYGVALMAYTLLPLPSGDLAAWCAQYGIGEAQLRPLQFVADIRRETTGSGLADWLRSPAVLQVVFNVVLFVPWGALTRRFLGWGLVASIASAFAMSMLIEVTQYSGIFGLIPCSYRVGDVDDLLANTVGGLLGAAIAPVLLRWLPRPGDLLPGRDRARPVGSGRRWLGMLVDGLLFLMVGIVLQVGHRLLLVVAERPLPVGNTEVDIVLAGVAPLVLVFLVPGLRSTGASWGMRMVWLQPTWEGRAGTARRRLLRAAIPGGLWGVLVALDLVPPLDGWTTLEEVAGPGAALVTVLAVVAVPFTRGHRGLSGVVSGADLVDTRSLLAVPEECADDPPYPRRQRPGDVGRPPAGRCRSRS